MTDDDAYFNQNKFSKPADPFVENLFKFNFCSNLVWTFVMSFQQHRTTRTRRKALEPQYSSNEKNYNGKQSPLHKIELQNFAWISIESLLAS